jgi:ABC-type Fe3+-citrate transport system substrate-binding protein
MVPSWTETPIACGANVVGRTRFCIHPENLVQAIRIVGGTKDISWEKIKALAPDLLILDREENPKSMADESPILCFSSDVKSIEALIFDLEKLARIIDDFEGQNHVAIKLRALSERWEKVRQLKPKADLTWAGFPSLIQWVSRPPETALSGQSVVYFIWKKPLMAVAKDTFIDRMLNKFGLSNALSESCDAVMVKAETNSRYPEIDLDRIPPSAILLFSSEPFPFHKNIEWILSLQRPAAIVDGEVWSWFGLRSLEFCERFLD